MVFLRGNGDVTARQYKELKGRGNGVWRGGKRRKGRVDRTKDVSGGAGDGTRHHKTTTRITRKAFTSD